MSKGFTIPKECRIECVVAPKKSDNAVTGVQLDAVGKRLMATDGRMLVELPVGDMEGETTALIPVDAIKLMRTTQVILHCDGKRVRISGKGVEKTFPLVEGVFPLHAGSLLDGVFNRRPEVVLCLNANYLKKWPMLLVALRYVFPSGLRSPQSPMTKWRLFSMGSGSRR